MEALKELREQNLTNSMLMQITEDLHAIRLCLENLTKDTGVASNKKKTLSAQDLADMLQISRSKAIKIMNEEGFPLIQGVGTRKLCYADEFYQWEHKQRIKNETV